MPGPANGSVGEKPRRFRRFNIEYPVLVQYYSGGITIEVNAATKNVSVEGILMSSPTIIPLHTPVSFWICIQSEQKARPILLAGDGKVVRVERGATETAFAIAVKCNSPITHLEECLDQA